MNITKYPQSCLRIAHEGHALLIDPGSLATAKYTVKEFGAFDAVLYTHSDIDHLDKSIIEALLATGATLYGNSNVCARVGGGKVEEIEERDELMIAGFTVQPRHLEHCLLADGSKTVPNTGFLINEYLLIPGDSTEDGGWQADVVATPIWGLDISFKDATDLIAATKAKKVIPYHFDAVNLNPHGFKRFFQMMAKSPAEVVVVGDAETVEI